jgi:hypothetical protein
MLAEELLGRLYTANGFNLPGRAADKPPESDMDSYVVPGNSASSKDNPQLA